MTSIAILGGAGFVGTNLALKAVARGHDVHIVDVADRFGTPRAAGLHSRVRFTACDLAQPGFELPPEADVVVNLAALPHVEYSMHRPRQAVSNNILSLVNVLEAVRERRVPLLFTSSAEVYGGNQGDLFVEQSPYGALSPYAGSKAAGEQILNAYRAAFALQATTVRLTNLYGPWQLPDRLVPRLITRMLTGIECEVDGDRLRHFIHVSDAAEALLTVIDNGIWGELFDLADGSAVATYDVARTLADLCQCSDSLRVAPARGFDGRGYSLVASGAHLHAATGWRPATVLNDGLAATVQWYRDHRPWWEQFGPYFQADRTDGSFIVDLGTWR